MLNLSSHTVNTYLRSAEQKLDVVNRVQAVTAACRLPII
ncbi:LuxR C-terminal-related transcriptional regulator [Rhizobium sp. BK313]